MLVGERPKGLVLQLKELEQEREDGGGFEEAAVAEQQDRLQRGDARVLVQHAPVLLQERRQLLREERAVVRVVRRDVAQKGHQAAELFVAATTEREWKQPEAFVSPYHTNFPAKLAILELEKAAPASIQASHMMTRGA